MCGKIIAHFESIKYFQNNRFLNEQIERNEWSLTPHTEYHNT